MLVKKLLLSSNYWVLNKNVVKTFGIETAFLLTNLAEAEQMMSTDDGWFDQTSDTLEELTTLSRYKQDNAIEQLENAGILEKDVRGIPAKRYFRLNYKALANKIVNNSQTSVQKNDKQVFKKLATNKELTIKKVDIESNKDHSSAKLTERFEALWKLYPRKQGKKDALKHYKRAVKEGTTDDEIEAGIQSYVGYIEKNSIDKRYVKHGSAWFNQEGWLDEYTTENQTKPSGNNFIDDLWED